MQVAFIFSNSIAYLIAVFYHDTVKATEDLESFAELNDQTLYKLLEKCMNPQTDIKTLAKRKVIVRCRSFAYAYDNYRMSS